MICEGRVVIVTGAARGIGREHALEFARQGASVVVNDVDLSEADEVAAEIGSSRAVACSDDVADWAGASRIVGAALEAFGRLDVVVNNAGFVRDRMFATTSEDEWDA